MTAKATIHYRLNREKTPNAPVEIYAPFGAIVVINRAFFELGGTLADSPFLFCEEIFLAEKLRSLGLKAVFDPRLRVIHRQHGSVGGLAPRQRASYARDSLRQVIRAFFS
jgi:GT2 family glycosyltransferase